MSIKEKIRNSDAGIFARREYWRYKGKKQYEQLSDYEHICKLYSKLGRKLNLKNPHRYTEKLQWLKLFYRNDLMPIVSDKYEVRKYLEDKGYGYLLNELIAVYENVDEINIDELPDQFVIKASHGSGWNLIVKDKSQVNWFWWKKIMRSWLKQNLSWFGREWNYANQKPRLIVEKYLEDDSGELRDYKIICLNGEPQFMQIDQNRSTNHIRIYVDENGQIVDMDDSQKHHGIFKVPFGDNQRKMFELARELSQPFPNVRIDFYEHNGKIYFGEFTFFGGSGFYSFEPDEWDYTWGEKLLLPVANYNLNLLRTINEA